MDDRDAEHPIVPDVVGLPFHVGRDVAQRARVALANPDPDGPPIGSIAWPGLFWIVRQDPAPGTTVREWGSVAVEVVADGDALDRAGAAPRGTPPTNTAEATPAGERRADDLRRAPQDEDAAAPPDGTPAP